MKFRHQESIKFFIRFLYFLKFFTFVYLVYSSLIFSYNYEQLLFRGVDDNAMITSVTYMQEAVIELDWSSVFFKYDYAYGWLFWVTYSIFSFPPFVFTKLFPSVQTFESIHIASNRVLSVIFVFMTVHLIRKIVLILLGKSGSKNQLIAEILSFSVLLFPSVGYWAGRVQPTVLTALLFVLTIFLLLSESYNTEPKKFKFFGIALSRIDFSVIAFGALIGTKPTAIPLTLIFITAYFLLRSGRNPLHVRGENELMIRHVGLGLLAVGFSASPSLFFMPIKTISRIYETIMYFSSNSIGQNIDLSETIFSLRKGFLLQGLGNQGLIVILLLSTFLYLRSRSFPTHFYKKCLVLLSAIPAVLFYSKVSAENLSMVPVYLFPLVVTQALLFPMLINQKVTKNSSPPIVFSIILLISISVNFYQNLATPTNNRLAINSYILDSKSTEMQRLISAQEKLLSAVGSKRPLTILQSYRSPTILSDLRSDVQTFYSFDNWGQFVGLNNVDYILLNDSDVAMLSGDDQKVQLDSQIARLSELREGINIVTRLIKLNKFSEQKCEKVLYQTGNTLYLCR